MSDLIQNIRKTYSYVKIEMTIFRLHRVMKKISLILD